MSPAWAMAAMPGSRAQSRAAWTSSLLLVAALPSVIFLALATARVVAARSAPNAGGPEAVLERAGYVPLSVGIGAATAGR
jgi:hypothetical protein